MHLDMLFVDLRMESTFLKETFNIKWVAQAGLVENIEQIVQEYKQSRGLLVMIHYFKVHLFPPNRNASTNTSLISLSENTWHFDIDAKEVNIKPEK